MITIVALASGIAIGVILGIWIADSTPVCTCGNADCGGGCIDWEGK